VGFGVAVGAAVAEGINVGSDVAVGVTNDGTGVVFGWQADTVSNISDSATHADTVRTLLAITFPPK
jgi:putative exporter of polyketide antibiotics